MKEVPSDNGDLSGIKYNCTLCKVYAYLNEAVQHVIGRKHRQRVLETYRPDLISWDSSRPQTISGKIVRAKAEVAERQDGRGKPTPLPERLKRQRSIQGGPKNGQGSSFTKDMEPTVSNFGRYSKGPGTQGSDDYVQKIYEDTFANRALLSDSEIFTERYEQDKAQLGYPGVRDYEREGSGDCSNVVGLQDQDRRQYSHSQKEVYTDVFRKPPAQKDVLKEFYTEELRREQLAKAQHDHAKTQREIGVRANQSSYSTSLDGKNSHDNYRLVQDYGHDASVDHPHEALSSLGPSRVSPSRSLDEIRTRKIAYIPDPFMRFLKGERSHEVPKERKRRSRFSDATAEELQTANEMFADECGPPNSKFSSLGPEMRELKTRQADPSYGLKQTDIYHKDPRPECSESTGDIFEMLKNIEIENEDDANFLKDRLCSILREFKARKAEKAAQTRPSRAITDYNNMRPVPLQHTQDRYDRTPRETQDIRRAEEPYDHPHQESFEEQTLVEDFQERKQPVPPEARYSNRKPYYDVKIWPSSSQPQHAPGYDMPDPGYDVPDPGCDMPAAGYDLPVPGYDIATPFPAKFQEPLRPRNHQSYDNLSNYQSSRSNLHMERGPRMNRPPYYSRNLDKITSTLLELVKRK